MRDRGVLIMPEIILLGLVAVTYLMSLSKSVTSLIRNFRYQSFFLFLAAGYAAYRERELSLYIIAALILLLKVFVIPYILKLIIKKINVKEDLGLLVNIQISMFLAMLFAWCAWYFAKYFISSMPEAAFLPAIALFITLMGLLLMIFRMTAIAQIVGLLVMENGLFLLASAIAGGMPFFVEIAIVFDVFISSIIMGFFIYRIKKLFTHIDVNKLSRLRG